MSISRAASFLGILVFSGLVCGQENTKLSGTEIFNRCYMKIFKSVIPRTAGLGKSLNDAVIAKKISGPQACKVLINKIKFVHDGVVEDSADAVSDTYPNLSPLENREAISTFHNFHNSWFSKKSLNFGNGNENTSVAFLRDVDEPSLYFTLSLFGKSVPLSTVFTSNQSLRGVRETPDKATLAWRTRNFEVLNEKDYRGAHPDQFVLSYGLANQTDVRPTGSDSIHCTTGSANCLKSMVLSDSQLNSFGRLIGVNTVDSSKASGRLEVPIVRLNTVKIDDTTQKKDLDGVINAKKVNLNILEHLGGGILGSQVFIMKNTNLTIGQIAPGESNDPDQLIARRLASRVFEDLLCHQMPTLSEADDIVKSRVNTNSPHGFRQSTSCMACHSSLDPMAYTFRNFASYKTSPNGIIANGLSDSDKSLLRSYGTPIIGVTKLPEKSGSNLFTLKPPTGSLNYRDHKNNLISVPVNGLADLGNKLSTSDDFYRCVAKRYYEFFTGYQVNLTERNIPEGTDTPVSRYHREKVYTLGAQLKNNKNLKTLINSILSSDAFIYRNFVPPNN